MSFRPKLFTVLKDGYSKRQFAADLSAGVIVGIIALPLAIAFAIASGVKPEQGLVTAVIAGFTISFLGGAESRSADRPAHSSSLYTRLSRPTVMMA